MDVTATIRNLRMAPRKMRLISTPMKGMSAQQAQHQFAYLTKRGALPLAKLIRSAIANSTHNFGLVESNLFIKDIIVNEGSKLKRFIPKGFGSASPIEKKTSHITVVLNERIAGLRNEASNKKSEKITEEQNEVGVRDISANENKIEQKKILSEKNLKQKKGLANKFKSKFFRRKAV